MPSASVRLSPIRAFHSETPNDLLCYTAELAQRFKSDGMLAYVETVQRKEKEIGCDVLTHQKWCVTSFASFR